MCQLRFSIYICAKCYTQALACQVSICRLVWTVDVHAFICNCSRLDERLCLTSTNNADDNMYKPCRRSPITWRRRTNKKSVRFHDNARRDAKFPAAFTVFRLLKAASRCFTRASLNHAAKVTLDVETHGYQRARPAAFAFDLHRLGSRSKFLAPHVYRRVIEFRLIEDHTGTSSDSLCRRCVFRSCKNRSRCK